VIETLAKILRKFDVIAVQEICTRQQDLLPLLVDRINQSDRRYDYMIGPRVGRTDNKEQFAFIFDTTRIETDRQQLYSVDDPEDLLHREPLVGWFRSTSISPELAFTFTLVNVHLDAELSDEEIRVLPELVRSIHRDGRKEDDVILVGDFGASDTRLQFLRSAGMTFALQGVPTTTHGNAMLDNIAMPIKATDEFNGRSGVFDFLRQFNLSIDQAHQVSDHLPVWAEFYANEGGQAGRVQ
jgi:endonuclease/exonuclease/phosphatase family metal-dependent hydrolase